MLTYASILAAAGARACIGWKFSYVGVTYSTPASQLTNQCPSRLSPSFSRLIETQAFLAELVENFQFDPPAEKVEIQRALAAMFFGMFPVVKGEADRGGAMPIRISFAQ